MQDIADANPANFVTHVIYGCWFVGRRVKYDTTSKGDTRLIEQVSVVPGRSDPLRPVRGGQPGGPGRTPRPLGILFQASQSNQAAANLLENFQLS